MSVGRSIGFAVQLLLLRFPELLDILLNSFIDPLLQFWAVSEGEKHLQPHEEGSEEECLEEAVQECRCSALKFPVADELGYPRSDM